MSYEWEVVTSRSDDRNGTSYTKSVRRSKNWPDIVHEIWFLPVTERVEKVLADGSIATDVQTLEITEGEWNGPDGITGTEVERFVCEGTNQEMVMILELGMK